jgi:phosphoglycolate phosphatase
MDNIYFDLDGTLTDPKPGITRSIQYALRKLDRAVPSEDELTWCIGPPLRASFATLLGDDILADRGVALYRERFADIGLYENAVYPDIVHVLTELARPGRRLFVATSKPAVYAKRIVEHFNLARHFETVFGSELDGRRVHKVELLAYAIDIARTDPARSIMIGDRSHDIVGAKQNAMDAIGVAYGYGSPEELIDAGASHICATPRDILGHIDGSG